MIEEMQEQIDRLEDELDKAFSMLMIYTMGAFVTFDKESTMGQATFAMMTNLPQRYKEYTLAGIEK